MTDSASPYKLKNPTEYHLLATQQTETESDGIFNVMDDQHLDYSEQFLSPLSNSPPFPDFDDMNSLPPSSSAMMIVPGFFSSHLHAEEESPSDYSSSLDMFSTNPYLYPRHNSISNDSTFVGSPATHNANMLYQHQHFSAPAHLGYDLMGHMAGLAAFHHPPVDSNTFTATGAHSLEEYETLQIKRQRISEKKRRRRESHNAVERRRRENINDRIQELGTMLPETMLEELASVSLNGNNNNKPNKGAILRKSVDHIRILQQEVTNHKQRIYELEIQLSGLTAK